MMAALAFGAATACTPAAKSINEPRLVDFATRYTAAWCSHDASRVAMFYSETGSLAINDGPPAVGRQAVERSYDRPQAKYRRRPDVLAADDRQVG